MQIAYEVYHYDHQNIFLIASANLLRNNFNLNMNLVILHNLLLNACLRFNILLSMRSYSHTILPFPKIVILKRYMLKFGSNMRDWSFSCYTSNMKAP